MAFYNPNALTPGNATAPGQTAASNQWSNTFVSGNGTPYAAPTQYANSQAQLGQAQASAVHDPLQATQLTEGNKMSRFNQILPLLSGQFGQFGSNGQLVGGQSAAPPPITAGPTLNPQQIQQQVNQGRATTDQTTAGNIARSNASVAGRGFGANSPLAMQLAQGYQNQGMATNAANETNTRLGAAQGNAQQLLASQGALSNQWNEQQQQDIARRQITGNRYNALISALSGLI